MLALVVLAALAVLGSRALPGRTPIPLDVASLFEPWRGELPPPVNPQLGDPVQQLTTAAYSAAALRAGHLPLLNPHVLSGHPVAGDSIAAPFNPLQMVLRRALGLHASLRAQVFIQLVLAGLAMGWWVDTVTRSRRAAAVAAVAWVMAGYQQVWLAYVYHLASLMWVPVVAVCWEKAARIGANSDPGGQAEAGVGRSGWAWAAAGGVAAGLCAHGGQVQISLYAAFVVSIYAVCAMLFLGVPRRAGVVSGVLIGVIGALVAAPTLLPALAQASDTVRAGFSAEALRATALPPLHALTALAPWLLGDPVRGDYAGQFNINELMVYAGLAPLILAMAAPFVRRDRLGWIAALMVGSVAFITLGWIGASLQAALPLVRYFGIARWVAVWPMALAFAAGVAVAGAEASPLVARRLRVGAAVAALSLAAILAAGAWWVVASETRTGLTGATGLASTLWPGDIPSADLLMPLFTICLSTVAIAWWCGSPTSRVRYGLLLMVLMVDLGAFATRYSPAGRVATAVPLLAPLDQVARAAAAEGVRVAPESGDAIVLGPGVAPLVGLDTIDGYSSALQASYARFVTALSEPTGNGFLEANPNVVAVGRVSPLLAKLLNVGYVLRAGDRPARSELVWNEPGCTGGGAASTGAESGDAAASGRGDVGGVSGRWRSLPAAGEVRGTFTPSADGLHRVDVFLRPADASPARARLSIRNAAGDEVASEVLELAAGPGIADATAPGSALTVYFARQAASAASPFTATLTTETPLEVCVDESGRLDLDAYAAEEPLEPAFAGHDVTAYRVRDLLGGAWEAADLTVVDDQASALAVVSAPGFDPAHTIVLEAAAEGADGSWLSGRRDETTESAPRSRLGVTRTSAGAVQVDVEPAAGGWVAVSQAFSPGWRATVDGEVAPVLRAYGGILGVRVPSGAREVRLSYAPREVRQGLALAAVGLLLAAGLVAADWGAHRRRGRPPDLPA